MGTQIMNGGIQGAILRILKNDGEELTKEQQERLDLLESLPKNTWIDLDNNGNPISKEEAEQNFREHLSKFKPIK